MARYGSDHKAATRQRILDSATRLFKVRGFDGSGIAGMMTEAGLTNGAFYAHFESKDDLVANVIAEQISHQADAIRALPSGPAGLELFIREYLTPEHRDNPSIGCPSAALLDEIARLPETAKQAYTEGASAIIDEIADRLGPGGSQAARDRAIGLYAMVVGALQLARALSDDELSREVLRSGVVNASRLIGGSARG